MRGVRGSGAAGYHAVALDRTPPLFGGIAAIAVPTLVVHGGHDVVFPPAHGRALAATIPGAELVEIAAMGHIFPPQWSDRILELVLDHLDRSRAPA